MQYLVIVKNNPGEQAKMALATRQVFTDFESAAAFADSLPLFRKAKVVSVPLPILSNIRK